MATLPNAQVLRTSLLAPRNTDPMGVTEPLQLLAATDITTSRVNAALSDLARGKLDRYIGPRALQILERDGLARAGRVDWSAVTNLVRGKDVLGEIRKLLATWPFQPKR
jgi:hypothetical protein